MSRLIFELYLPIKQYLESIRRPGSPLLVGISAPQGCGKTTMTNQIASLFKQEQSECISVSIDDFYLTGEEQVRLADKHKDNPLLTYRGNAGSHDVSLLHQKLLQLKDIKSNHKDVLIPRYDKSLRSGRGDRLAEESWSVVKDADVVLLEGWMLGYHPYNITEASAAHVKGCSFENILEINSYLKAYTPVHELIDAWIIFTVDQPSNIHNIVYKWRLQAEHNMIKSGKSGLSDEQVKDFVSRYVPAYQVYLPNLSLWGPQRRSTKSKTADPHWHTVYDLSSSSANRDWGKSLQEIILPKRGDCQYIPVIKITVDEYRNPIRVEILTD